MAEDAQATATETETPTAPLTEDQILDQIEQDMASEAAAVGTDTDSEADSSAQDQGSAPTAEVQEPGSETDASATPDKPAETDTSPKTLTLAEHEARLAQSKTDQEANVAKRVEEAIVKAKAEERAAARQAQEKADYDALPAAEKAQKALTERSNAAIVEAAKPRLFREWGAEMGQSLSPMIMETFGFDPNPEVWSDEMKTAWTKYQEDYRGANSGENPGFASNVGFLKTQYEAAKEAEFTRRLEVERKKWTGAADESNAAVAADSEVSPPVVASVENGASGGLPATFELTENLLASTSNPSPQLMAHYRKKAAEAGVTI